LLKRFNPGTNRRLAYAERFGGFVETAVSEDGKERLNLIEFHCSPAENAANCRRKREYRYPFILILC
jgi:hypothetical protein